MTTTWVHVLVPPGHGRIIADKALQLNVAGGRTQLPGFTYTVDTLCSPCEEMLSFLDQLHVVYAFDFKE